MCFYTEQKIIISSKEIIFLFKFTVTRFINQHIRQNLIHTLNESLTNNLTLTNVVSEIHMLNNGISIP